MLSIESIAKMTNDPGHYLAASASRSHRKTYRDMEESQVLLEPNLGTSAKAKEYYEKALEECGLTSLTLDLQYNETEAPIIKAASEFLHKFCQRYLATALLELMAGSTSVLNSYIKGWKEGDPNSFEFSVERLEHQYSAPWNGLGLQQHVFQQERAML